MKVENSSLKRTARLAGLFDLLAALTIGFSLGYVRPTLIAAGDAAATAGNITAHESLFRLGIASNIFSQFFLLFFGLAVYRVFKEVDRTWAKVLLTSILLSVAVGVVNSFNNFGALLVLGDAAYLKAFQPEQINALMMVFLRLNNFGIGLLELFTALSLFSFGLLIVRSNYIPRILGVLLMIGSCAFPVNTFTKLLVPQFYPATFTQLAMFCGALSGIPVMLWLLIKGVREQPQASED